MMNSELCNIAHTNPKCTLDHISLPVSIPTHTHQLLETRVSNFTANAERTIGAAYPGTQSNVNAELQKLTTRWTDLKDQVRNGRKTIDLTVEYFKLSDKVRNTRIRTIPVDIEITVSSTHRQQIDENYHNALNQLAAVTKDIPNVKTDTAVGAFNEAIDRFVNANETPQMNQLKQLAQLSHQIYGFDKTVTTFNDHIALYQSFAKLKADIAAIAEQIRIEEEHRLQQLKLQDQLLEQQKQQSLLQQQQQDLMAEKQKLEQQLRLQQQQQQQQKDQLALEMQQQHEQQRLQSLMQQQQQDLLAEKQKLEQQLRLQQQQQQLQQEQLALELQQQREQQEKLLQLQQQQQLQQRQQLEQQLLEQQQHQLQLQAEQQLLQQQLEEQISAAAAKAAVVAVPQLVSVDETDKRTSSSVVHDTLITSSTTHITQKSEIVYEYPRFVRPLCDATVQEGDRFTFECIVTGQPQPTVEWFKDGRSINTNADYKTAFDGAQCTLTIDESIPADSARFTCKASNVAGQSETTALLSVQEPIPLVMLESPNFVRLLQSGCAREGASFEFSCCVTGNPLPTVQWFKNDQCVDLLKDFHITFNNGEALLRLEEVFLEDQAVFTCKATNPYGTEQSSALLTVERRFFRMLLLFGILNSRLSCSHRTDRETNDPCAHVQRHGARRSEDQARMHGNRPATTRFVLDAEWKTVRGS